MRLIQPKTGRRISPFVPMIVLLPLLLAACGGGSNSETPTPTAKPLPRTPTPSPVTTASPIASPFASPGASPVASPGASPVASPATVAIGKSITRDEFQSQLLKAFPMQPAAHKGGQLILSESNDISTVNPIVANDSTTFNITGAIFETLVGGSPIDGKPIPALADYWDVAPDGVTYTFHL